MGAPDQRRNGGGSRRYRRSPSPRRGSRGHYRSSPRDYHRLPIIIILQINLFFLSVGHFYPMDAEDFDDAENSGDAQKQFRIDKVTGPDEYSAIVNNNYYTNMLAKKSFEWGLKFIDIIEKEDKDCIKKLLHKLDINKKDLDSFKNAVNTYLPFDEKKNILLQDDSFLALRDWDESDDLRPLLLHYHPLRIYSAKILKQADAVLAMFLSDENLSADTIKNTYHFYENITTHDSSLSSCLYGIMACKINDLDKATQYFMDSAFLDINDTHSNTKDGLHMANLAGNSMYFIYGFAGVRVKEDGLHINPIVPKGVDSYSFKIYFKGSLLEIKIGKDTTVTLLEGDLEYVYLNGEKQQTKTENS